MTGTPQDHRGRLLTRSEWLERGVHERRLASADFTRVFPNFHTPSGHPASFTAMAWTLQSMALPGCVLSHSSAALLWGIPLPSSVEAGVGWLHDGSPRRAERVPIIPALRQGASLREGAKLPLLHCRITPHGTSGPACGVRVHRWRAGPTATLGALVLSTPEETLREIATMLPTWDVVAALDALLAPDPPIRGVTPESVAAHAEAGPGTAGAARLAAAAALSRRQVRSPGESIMRLLVTAVGLPEPRPNLLVAATATEPARYLDLAWEGSRVALEYDGDLHRLTRHQWRYDETRRDELASRGWTLVRAQGEDLARPRRLLLRLARVLADKGERVPGRAQLHRRVDKVHRTRPTFALRPEDV